MAALPASPRLRYRPVVPDDVDALHALAVDPHIRRYLFDGEVVPREWAAEVVEASRRGEGGAGLWLLFERDDGPPSGDGIGDLISADVHTRHALAPAADHW